MFSRKFLTTVLHLSSFLHFTTGVEMKDHVFFRERGRTITTRGHLHVQVTLDLPAIEKNIFTIQLLINKLQVMNADHGKIILARHEDELAKLASDIRMLRNIGGDITNREKRQLDFLLGLGGTILGLYNMYEIGQLKGTVAAQSTAITDLFHELDVQKSVLSQHGVMIEHLQDALQVTVMELHDYEIFAGAVQMVASLVEAVRMQVMRAMAVVDQLNNQRLSVAAVQKGGMKTMLLEASAAALERGYELLVKNPSGAHQCPTSYVTTPTGTIIAFLHIPLAKIGDTMTVFEYLRVPNRVTDGLYMTVEPEHAIIATDDKRTEFITMSLTTLSACDKSGSYYVCPDSNSKHKAAKVAEFEGEIDTTLCTWFLLTQDEDKIKKACSVHLRKAQSQIFEITGTEFVFVEKVPHQGQLSCHGKETEHIRVDGPTKVSVPPGCTFDTNTGSATGVLDLALNMTAISYAWLMDPDQLLADLDLPRYKELVDLANSLKTKIPTDVKEAHDWITAQDRWNNRNNMTYSNVTLWCVVIGIIIVIACGAVIYWKYSKRTLLRPPSAPIDIAMRPWGAYHPENEETERPNKFRQCLR